MSSDWQSRQTAADQHSRRRRKGFDGLHQFWNADKSTAPGSLFSVNSPNHRSARFSQLELVGMKWGFKPPMGSQPGLHLRCLVRAVIVQQQMQLLLPETHGPAAAGISGTPDGGVGPGTARSPCRPTNLKRQIAWACRGACSRGSSCHRPFFDGLVGLCPISA